MSDVSNASGVTIDTTPYTDTGTGAYPTPSEPITVEGVTDVTSTGAVETPGPVTIDAHLDNSTTGAHPTPGPATYSSGIIPTPAASSDVAVAAPAPQEPAAAPVAPATQEGGA